MPFTVNAPASFVYVELPSALVISPFTVIPPSPLFVTIVLPVVVLLTLASLSTKIPSTPVLDISKLPPEFDTSAPLFTDIPVPVLSNFRLPPSLLTLPFTINLPFLFIYDEFPVTFDAVPLITIPPSPVLAAVRLPLLLLTLPVTVKAPELFT